MRKYKGGTRLNWRVIFFVLFLLFFLIKFSLVSAKVVYVNQIEQNQNKETIFFDKVDKDLLELEDIKECDPPPESLYTRNWDLASWLKTNSALEATLRSLKTTQIHDMEPSSFEGVSWKKEINQFRKAWNAFIGPIPKKKCVSLSAQEEPLGLNDKELALVNTSSYRMTKVSYRGVHGQRIPAFLLVPNSIKKGDKVPAVLVMHQSLAVCGKKEAAGVCLQGTPWLNFAQDFAEKGYVTLAPDSIGYGERAVFSNDTGLEYSDAAPLLSRFPSSTLMGLRVSDVMRGVDFLRTLPFVDREHIGMIGHSNGGIETLFNAAFDKRIKCAVSNSGPNILRRETLGWWGWNPGVARWAGSGYVPAIGFFNNDINNLPIETHQLYAMIAPRGLFLSLTEDDSIAPKFDRIQFSMDQTKKVFDALGGDFAYHTIKTGLTVENHKEWAAPMSMAENYTACIISGNPVCAAKFADVGMDAKCVEDRVSGYPEYCAHDLWKNCLDAGHTEDECLIKFVDTGITTSSVEDAFQKYLRRDHGWYPETETEAYPWLENCLKR